MSDECRLSSTPSTRSEPPTTAEQAEQMRSHARVFANRAHELKGFLGQAEDEFNREKLTELYDQAMLSWTRHQGYAAELDIEANEQE